MADRYISTAEAALICSLASRTVAETTDAESALPAVRALRRAVRTAVRHIEQQQTAQQDDRHPDDAMTVRVSMHDQYVFGWALSR